MEIVVSPAEIVVSLMEMFVSPMEIVVSLMEMVVSPMKMVVSPMEIVVSSPEIVQNMKPVQNCTGLNWIQTVLTLMVFLKYFIISVNFEKKSANVKK